MFYTFDIEVISLTFLTMNLPTFQNLEKWIAQKRAEIAKEKAEIGGDKENNVPPTVTSKSQPPTQINRGSVGQPVQSNEPLIFKLGDDYQLRKESGTPFLFLKKYLYGINYTFCHN